MSELESAARTVLVVGGDDETIARVQSLNFRVLTAADLDPDCVVDISADPDVVLLSEDLGWRRLTEAARARWPLASVVVLTDSTESSLVANVLEAGADRSLPRPFSEDALALVLDKSVQSTELKEEVAHVRLHSYELVDAGEIIGQHPAMQQVLKRISQVAPRKATILVHGETGTGKELIAQAIHRNSLRRDGPFVPLNCAALSEAVLESELFGHEQGSFTGALGRREGRFMQAHGGTLFLDEVSEIPYGLQVKLLRFLQDRTFARVGANEEVSVDVRIVAATNRDLQSLVEDGAFREDLYYRLNVVRIEVPPLRARPSDILLLADHFARRFAADEGLDVSGFDGRARERLLAYPWPGNVRELENVIEQAVITAEGDRITEHELAIASVPAAQDDAVRLMIPGITLAELERYAILKTLEAVGGSPSRAAKVLGISRRTIQYRLREWGMNKPESSTEDDVSP